MSTPAPKLPADLPVDFTSEVYCPAKILHELTLLYPLGADVLGIIGEYLGKMILILNRTPQYIVRETINVSDEEEKK